MWFSAQNPDLNCSIFASAHMALGTRTTYWERRCTLRPSHSTFTIIPFQAERNAMRRVTVSISAFPLLIVLLSSE